MEASLTAYQSKQPARRRVLRSGHVPRAGEGILEIASFPCGADAFPIKRNLEEPLSARR
jgi:hypothetical protein